MELATFELRPRDEMIGDQLKAQDAVDKALVVQVREHRTGIKTKFNQTPGEKGYKADGQDGVTVDVADVAADKTWIDVLWLNGAIVDNLAPYVGQVVPIKLHWQAPANGGNSYISLTALTGAELTAAQGWATANATRFDTERAKRIAEAGGETGGRSGNAEHWNPTGAEGVQNGHGQPAAAPVAQQNGEDPALTEALAKLPVEQAAAFRAAGLDLAGLRAMGLQV